MVGGHGWLTVAGFDVLLLGWGWGWQWGNTAQDRPAGVPHAHEAQAGRERRAEQLPHRDHAKVRVVAALCRNSPLLDTNFACLRLPLDSEVGHYDRVVIQEILKEIAQTQQVDLNAKQRFKGALAVALRLSVLVLPRVSPSLSLPAPCTHPTASPARLVRHARTQVVVIHEADSLSRDAQAALRRTMEKYMSNMRLVLCANSTSKLIAPIRSRCLLMRVAAPSADEVRLASCTFALL